MTINFKALCSKLNLPATFDQESSLRSIERWCHENISQDVCYGEASNSENYRSYLVLSEAYLDQFLAHKPSDFAQGNQMFSGLSAISHAAQKGYDRFITDQPTIPEALLNERDVYGMTPLHKAAIQGHLYTVRALLAKGADAHVMNSKKQLPVHCALFIPMMHNEELLERKQNIVHELLPLTSEAFTMQDIDGNTLLHLLATYGFDVLLAELVDTNPELALIKNNACIYPIHAAILNQKIKAVNVLISIDGVADSGDEQKRLPLHYAARYGTSEMVQSCCNATNNIDSKDIQGRSPLLWAAFMGNQDALETLVLNGADTTLTDYEGTSILHFAVKEQHESMVHWIVDNTGLFLLDQMDIEGKTPLFYAQENGNKRIVDFLRLCSKDF